MQGTIKVSTAELRSAASAFSSCGSNISSKTRAMLDLVSAISGSVWSGEASMAYKNKFAGLQDDIEKINKMIQEHVDDLNAMAETYDRAEQEAQQQASSLNSDVI